MQSPISSDPWIGRLIGNRQRYRLDKLLGAGGMGDVFLAMDTLLGQQVALKLLKDKLAAKDQPRKRFEREVALCAALKSSHIVEVSDCGVTAEGYPFYVMEYLQGQTLGQLLRREQRLSVERTVGIITQVCEGLRLAHEGITIWRNGATVSEHVKVVHRDLKPDNIFIVPKAQGELVKILDFGIAKIRNDSSEQTNLTSMFLGTYHYAAPEQLGVDKDLDGRADIYSLGIILYEMLSGTDPFGLGLHTHKISGMSWALAHTSKPPVPLRSQLATEQLSPELEAVVMRCLQKVPNDRFASVDELKRALVAAVTVPSRPSPPPRRKSPLLLTGAGIAIAITATAAAQTYLRWHPSESNTVAQIRALQAEAKYAECINKAKTVTGNSHLYFKAQELLNQCQLEQAKKLAKESKLAKAITAASTIPKDSPLYSKAQKLSEQWSNAIMTLATAQFQAGKLDLAIAIAQAIPATSPAHQKAPAAIAQWKKDWQVAETQFGTAQKALDAGNWQVAIDESNKIPNISFWQQKIKPVVQSAQAQISKAEAQQNYEPPSPTVTGGSPGLADNQVRPSPDSPAAGKRDNYSPPKEGWEDNPSVASQSGNSI